MKLTRIKNDFIFLGGQVNIFAIAKINARKGANYFVFWMKVQKMQYLASIADIKNASIQKWRKWMQSGLCRHINPQWTRLL